jgi:hypothetical protein
MKYIYILSILFSFASYGAIEDLDVLIAKTSMALGDEYAKLADTYQGRIKTELNLHPEFESSNSDDVPQSFKFLKEKYLSYKNLTVQEYQLVFCNNACTSPLPLTGLELPVEYGYLVTEAITKSTAINSGTNSNNVVGKYASIYAVNSNFEEQLLGKVSKIVEVQQRLDLEARKLKDTLRNLESAYVDLKTEEIVGVEQGLLQAENYSLENQSQIAGYKSCIESSQLEKNFEQDEYNKSVTQVELLTKDSSQKFSEAFDSDFDAPTNKVLTVYSNLSWQNSGVELTPDSTIYISSSGKWYSRTAVAKMGANPNWLNIPLIYQYDNISYQSDVTDASTYSITFDQKYIPNEDVKNRFFGEGGPYLHRILSGLDTNGDGYYLSFSISAGSGFSTSSGTGSSYGFSGPQGVLGMGQSTSESSGGSTSSGFGTSGVYPLKILNTNSSKAPVGSLLGTYCETSPQPNDVCSSNAFYIGAGSMQKVPTNIGSKKLWLVSNDYEGDDFPRLINNGGSLQVQIRKQVKFITYWNEFYDWYDNECDPQGLNCGLKKILENIAYTPNPYIVAKSAIVKNFPSFPEPVINLILQQINYLIELKIAQKELKSKELSMELQRTKNETCRLQLENSQKVSQNTKELIDTYQRKEQNIEIKEEILAISKSFYENELVAINGVRERNLQRIKRYYELTVNSYNYLYLDNFVTNTIPQSYFEGDFYKEQLELMQDLIFEITSTNDLLNPNRGFVVYELSKDELTRLIDRNFRKRTTQFQLNYENFLCQGFNLENQGRVMVEKVGVLLDIDSAKEHLFFKNPSQRNSVMQITHGLENKLYDFTGRLNEFWMPLQKKNITAHSTRILVDSGSDYYQLRDSRFFERLSFRKTSLASTWKLEFSDPNVMMYEPSDTAFQNPLLKGVKFIVWFNSSELLGDIILNKCLNAPTDLAFNKNGANPDVVSWSFSKSDPDFNDTTGFTVYESESPRSGFKILGHISKGNCSSSSEELNCQYTLDEELTSKRYFQVRSTYTNSIQSTNSINGIPSSSIEVNPSL